jgi:CBS domain-containing protein
VLPAAETERALADLREFDLKGSLPMCLGLLAESDPVRLEAALSGFSSQTAGDVMTKPVVTVSEDRQLSEAVNVMLVKGVKRLPVMDADGRIKGTISRDSLLRTGIVGAR